MNKTIEILAMVLGGISILTVCFLGFAVMSGVPLHRIAGIGKLFPAPTSPEAETAAASVPAGDPSAPDARQESVLLNQAGLLHAWSLPSPYTAEELQGLADGLRQRGRQLDARASELDAREGQLDEREETLQGRMEGLGELQGRLDAQRTALETLRAEVEARQSEMGQRLERKWTAQAKLLEEMKPDARAAILAGSLYAPEEMAQLLHAMTEATRAEVMAELGKGIEDPALLRKYLEAYGDIAEAEPVR
ncbi:MAG: hypothetical protein AB1726_11125 [Planctomycetota bacterium]